jgi:hypothetical protein
VFGLLEVKQIGWFEHGRNMKFQVPSSKFQVSECLGQVRGFRCQVFAAWTPEGFALDLPR